MYQWRKGIASWKVGKVLYLSVPFTWLMAEAKAMASEHKGKVIAGGPAVALMGAEWADTPDTCPYDTLAMHNPCATFTTRGCPNKCKFCAVPRIEGEFIELDSWKPAPVVCDNNIMAASKRHFERVIDSLLPFPYVDFNQGLDARLFTKWHADQLARLKRCKVRFALDHSKFDGIVHSAIETARRAGLKDFGVYVLMGFGDTPEDARHRLELVRSWDIWPQAMRYQPLDAPKRNCYVDPGWTDRELKRMQRYYSRLAWLEHIPYEDFEYLPDDGQTDMFKEAK